MTSAAALSGSGDMSRRRYGTVRLTIKARLRSYTAAMPTARDPLYQRHRFPPEVISHAVWLYGRSPRCKGFFGNQAMLGCSYLFGL